MFGSYSVVIPAFNAGRFVRRTIDSVLAQTYSADEIIVVDDGSTDNTAEIVKSYGAKVRYIYQENAGDGPARNTGIAAAKGEWIAFLDHDDEWLPQKLQLQIDMLNRNPDLRWCAANFYKQSDNRRAIDVNSATIGKALGGNEYFENFFTAVRQKGGDFMTTTMVIHRDVFKKVGVFDSCWLRGADIDMWWRIAYHFPKIGYLTQPLAVLHVGVQDITSTKLRLESKRGADARKLIGKHLQLAREYGCLDSFRPYAKKFLRKRLIAGIYNGFKADSRATVTQFPGLFPWHWRFATYILTIFPKITSVTAKTLAYLWHKLGLEREVSRRWINIETIETENKE